MPTTRLANAHADSEWCRHAWSDFAALAGSRTLAVLPVYGLADHGLGYPLDIEEIMGGALLKQAVAALWGKVELLVLPPLRWTLGPYPSCAFGIDPDLAHDLVHEIAASVQAAGCRRLLFFNTSPWNEELVDAASRDTRAALGLQTFVINLSGLGLDLHPASMERKRAQALVGHLLGTPSTAPTRTADVLDMGFRPGRYFMPPAVHPDADCAGQAVFDDAAAHLARLLVEVGDRAPLDGAPSGVQPGGTPATTSDAPPATASHPGDVWPAYRPRYLGSLTWDQLRNPLLARYELAILPVGAIEQHGHHLPVGVDAILGQAWVEAALAALPADAPVWVAPPITYGKSNEHIGFPGTVWISAATLRRLVIAAVEYLHHIGFRTVALLNTHGGNSAVLVYTIRELQVRMQDLRIGMVSHTGYEPTPTQEPLEREYGFHAGQWETALMLACAPDTVRMEKAVREFPPGLDAPGELRPENAPAIYSWITSDISRSGVLGDATIATAEDGRRWLDEASSVMARHLLALLESPPAPPPAA